MRYWSSSDVQPQAKQLNEHRRLPQLDHLHRLHGVIDSRPDYLFTVDQGGIIQSAATATEFVGTSVYDLFHTESYVALQCAVERAFEEGLPDRVINETHSIHIYPMFQDGKVVLAAVMSSATAGPKQLMDDLKAQLHLYSAIVEAADVLIVVMDIDGHILHMNPMSEQISGYQASEMIHKFFWDLHAPEDQPFLQANFKALPQHHQADWIVKDNQHRKIDWTMIAVQSPDGMVTYVVATGIDITDQKEIENNREELIRELRNALRVKNEFLPSVSRKLRMPLDVVIGTLNAMLHSGTLPDQGRYTVSSSEFKVKGEPRMNTATAYELAPSVMSLRYVVDALRAYFSPLAKQKRLLLTVHVDPTLPEAIYIDEHALTTIMINMLTNAIKFTDKGNILLRMSQQDNNLVIDVSDTGMGIMPDMQEIIFESLDSFTKRAAGGSGMGAGLAIIRHLADAMGGSTHVSSAPGQGTTFTVILPLIE